MYTYSFSYFRHSTAHRCKKMKSLQFEIVLSSTYCIRLGLTRSILVDALIRLYRIIRSEYKVHKNRGSLEDGAKKGKKFFCSFAPLRKGKLHYSRVYVHSRKTYTSVHYQFAAYTYIVHYLYIIFQFHIQHPSIFPLLYRWTLSCISNTPICFCSLCSPFLNSHLDFLNIEFIVCLFVKFYDIKRFGVDFLD